MMGRLRCEIFGPDKQDESKQTGAAVRCMGGVQHIGKIGESGLALWIPFCIAC